MAALLMTLTKSGNNYNTTTTNTAVASYSDTATSGTGIWADNEAVTVNGTAYTVVGTTTVGGVSAAILKTGTGGQATYFLFFFGTAPASGTTVGTNTTIETLGGTATYTPCFLAGTLVATADGDKAIETLEIGDRIVLKDGSTKPVKWLGRRTAPLHAFNRHVASPILIKAGALGNGLPQRDLYTSYRHAFELEGVIVIAGLLVNGTSIVQCTDWPQDSVTYYSVEVEGHELMLVEGASCETFGEDGENRSFFDNAGEFHAMYPQAVPAEPMPLGRVVTSRQMPRAVRARLAAAAVECGYAQRVAAA